MRQSENIMCTTNLIVVRLLRLFEKMVSKSLKDTILTSNSFLSCPRKICKKIYKIEDISNLSIDRDKGGFLCSNVLNFNVICGSKLVGDENSFKLETNNFKILESFILSLNS